MQKVLDKWQLLWYNQAKVKGSDDLRVFVDFDDTLARSSETVVNYFNERYGLSKTEDDIHDWCYRSIYRGSSPELTNAIYAGDYFWSNVKLFDGAVDILDGHNVSLCTCGNEENLRRKHLFLVEHGLPYKEAFIDTRTGFGRDKCRFDMTGAIQIDDRTDALLHTNAAVKILFKNFHNHEWQHIPAGANIYAVDTWDEIKEIMGWFNDN